MSPTVQYVPRLDSEITTIKVSFSELVVCMCECWCLVSVFENLSTIEKFVSFDNYEADIYMFVCIYTYVNTYICEYMHMHVNVRLCIKLISSIKRISMFR